MPPIEWNVTMTPEPPTFRQWAMERAIFVNRQALRVENDGTPRDFFSLLNVFFPSERLIVAYLKPGDRVWGRRCKDEPKSNDTVEPFGGEVIDAFWMKYRDQSMVAFHWKNTTREGFETSWSVDIEGILYGHLRPYR